MKTIVIAFLAAAALAVVSPPSRAWGASAVIDFESLAGGTFITNQYADLGIVFSGGLYADPFPLSTIQGNKEATNYRDGLSISNPISATFAAPQTAVHFRAAGDLAGSAINLMAFSGATLVGQGDFLTAGPPLPGGNLASVAVSLSIPQGFDRIAISRTNGNRAFSIDDLQFTPIPEPAGLVPALLALIAVAGRSARSKQVLRVGPMGDVDEDGDDLEMRRGVNESS